MQIIADIKALNNKKIRKRFIVLFHDVSRARCHYSPFEIIKAMDFSRKARLLASKEATVNLLLTLLIF
jgi:hypothetical protein